MARSDTGRAPRCPRGRVRLHQFQTASRLEPRRATLDTGAAFADVDAFMREHQLYGQGRIRLGQPGPRGYAVPLACLWGGVFTRWVTPQAAEQDLSGLLPPTVS